MATALAIHEGYVYESARQKLRRMIVLRCVHMYLSLLQDFVDFSEAKFPRIHTSNPAHIHTHKRARARARTHTNSMLQHRHTLTHMLAGKAAKQALSHVLVCVRTSVCVHRKLFPFSFNVDPFGYWDGVYHIYVDRAHNGLVALTQAQALGMFVCHYQQHTARAGYRERQRQRDEVEKMC